MATRGILLNQVMIDEDQAAIKSLTPQEIIAKTASGSLKNFLKNNQSIPYNKGVE